MIRVIHDSHDYWGRTADLVVDVDGVVFRSSSRSPGSPLGFVGPLDTAIVPAALQDQLAALRRARADASARSEELRELTRELWMT